MAQQPFTPQGVQDKQDELYGLSDAGLLSECQGLMSNFSHWVQTNFSLTPQQITYLTGISSLARFNLSAVIAAGLSARRPIIMKAPPSYGPPRRTKQIKIKIFGWLFWFPPVSGGGEITGDLEIEIDWAVVD